MDGPANLRAGVEGPTPVGIDRPGWRGERLSGLVAAMTANCERRPFILAIDGRGGAGKTTLADRVLAATPRAAVVHTDDVAWHAARFDWGESMVTGILDPVRRGTAVGLRPRAWEARGRCGSIVVPAGIELLVLEGSGAGRRAFADHLDGLLWLHAEAAEIAVRERARIAAGETTRGFVEQWQAEERAFFAADRPWARAELTLATTPAQRDPDRVWVPESAEVLAMLDADG